MLANGAAGEVLEKRLLGCDEFHVLAWKTGFSSHTVHNMVNPQLLEAYRRTSFIIEAPHCEINLRVGEPSDERGHTSDLEPAPIFWGFDLIPRSVSPTSIPA